MSFWVLKSQFGEYYKGKGLHSGKSESTPDLTLAAHFESQEEATERRDSLNARGRDFTKKYEIEEHS